MSKIWAIDFETFYTSKYSLKNMIAEEYCRDSRFDAYLMSAACDDGTEWAGNPCDFDWSQLEDAIVLAHNKYFDYTVWLELHRQGLVPEPKFREFHCTANLTSYLCNCRALAQAVSFLYNVQVSKQARTDMKDKHWEDLDGGQRETMIKYALDDVRWCLKIWRDHSGQWPECERELSNLTIQQGMDGIQINTDLLEEYLSSTHEAIESTKRLIPWIEDGKAPSSKIAIAAECRKNNIPCPPVKSEDEEGFLEWENTYAPQYPWIKAVSCYRSLSKLLATFETVKRRLRDDNTMPFALKYFGAHTGRWSGDANLNLQNPRKESVLINEHLLMETDQGRIKEALKTKKDLGQFPDWVKSEINFRYLLVARPGFKMITADLSQIEPRVLAWCAKDWPFLDLLAKGVSPYIVHARQTMGWDDSKDKDSDPAGYALAKSRVLGLGYGCGWEKFITVAAAMGGIDITKDDPETVEIVDEVTGNVKIMDGYGWTSKQIVKDYRERNPLIASMDPDNPGIWLKLDTELKDSVGEDFVMNLPSWRAIRYRGVRIEFRTVVDKDDPDKVRTKRVWTADLGHKRSIFYGGLLTENLVQAISRDVFAFLMLLLTKRGYRILFTCHDEVILEVPLTTTRDDIASIMTTSPPWLKRCPIKSDVKEVPHYCK